MGKIDKSKCGHGIQVKEKEIFIPVFFLECIFMPKQKCRVFYNLNSNIFWILDLIFIKRAKSIVNLTDVSQHRYGVESSTRVW